MAHFYGSMSNGKGEATRAGSKVSGLSAHIRGWNVGVSVRIAHLNGVDTVKVYRTSGSAAGGHCDNLIAEFAEGGFTACDNVIDNRH